jgi:hypothetical protein
MISFLRILLALLLIPAAASAYSIRALITVTNAPIGNTNTLTINGSARTFTNTVTASPSTLIRETNSVYYTATNIANHLTAYSSGFGNIIGMDNASNVTIRALPNRALTVTLAGLWGTIVLETNTTTDAIVVRVPLTVEATTNRTNIASQLVQGLSDYSTIAFASNSVPLSNFITKGASPLQIVAAPVQFNGGLRGGAIAFTNGFTSATTNINPVSSNAVNYGNALRSEGSGGNSFQAGSNAVASGARSVALGNSATASAIDAIAGGTSAVASNLAATAYGNAAVAGGDYSSAYGQGSLAATNYTSAFGQGAQATAFGASAIGNLTLASGFYSVALGIEDTIASGPFSLASGPGAAATAWGASAFGYLSASTHSNSTAVGASATTTETNQVRIGTSAEKVSIPGLITDPVSTNSTLKGTNILNGRLDLTSRANTSLANGNNAGVVLGTNVYLRLSGPSAAYVINGIAAGQDGTWHIIEADNPTSSLTIANQSGTDPTAANRIVTGTGADIVLTNQPAMFQMIYNISAARWRVVTHSR